MILLQQIHSQHRLSKGCADLEVDVLALLGLLRLLPGTVTLAGTTAAPPNFISSCYLTSCWLDIPQADISKLQ